MISTPAACSNKKFTKNSNYSNSFAASVGWLGHKLTYLSSLTLEQGAKVGSPLTPGFHGQCDSKLKEVCTRILRILLCILLSWTLVLAVVGGCMRLLASLAKRNFTLTLKDDQPALQNNAIEQIKIRTFNVAMMPEFICVSNKVRPTRQRIQEVANLLLKKDDDILCLQELFHSEAADDLTEQLQKRYPYIISNVDPRSFGLNSGLMIASKYPLVHVDFWRHTNRGGMDAYANKGALAVTIKPSSNQTLVVVNTHLNGGAPSSTHFPEWGKSYREDQIKQLKTNMKAYVNQSTERNGMVPAVVFTGDYNIGPLAPRKSINGNWETTPDPEWATIKDLMHPLISDNDARGTTFELGQDPVTGWDQSQLDRWEIKPEYVDHIGLGKVGDDNSGQLPLQPIELIDLSVDPMGGSSDHLAVAATFKVTAPSSRDGR